MDQARLVTRGKGGRYLYDGVDEKGVGVGEDEDGGVEAGGGFEELNAALHRGVLEGVGASRMSDLCSHPHGETHKRDLAHGAFDIVSLYAAFWLGQLEETLGAFEEGVNEDDLAEENDGGR